MKLLSDKDISQKMHVLHLIDLLSSETWRSLTEESIVWVMASPGKPKVV